jgi:hypothetical protein
VEQAFDYEAHLNKLIEQGRDLQLELTRGENNKGRVIDHEKISNFGKTVNIIQFQFFKSIGKNIPFGDSKFSEKYLSLQKSLGVDKWNEDYKNMTRYWRDNGGNSEAAEDIEEILNEIFSKRRSNEEGWKEIISDYSERIIENECVWINKDWKQLRDMKNIHHEFENWSSKKRNKLRDNINSRMIERFWEEALLTHRILRLIESKECSVEAINDEKNAKDKKFKNRFYGKGANSEDVINHLKKMGWGTENYIRSRSVIKEAKELVENHPVVIFNGLGGTGKTALANKIMIEFADDAQSEIKKSGFNPSSFLALTTKNNDQGEFNYESEDNRSEVENPPHFKSLRVLLSEDIQGAFRKLCNSIIEQYLPVDPDWSDEKLEEECLEYLKEDNWLIIIDNFEDIASPNESNKKFKQIRIEFNKITSFLEKLQKVGAKNNNSRIIITSRVKETYSWGVTYSVPLLDGNYAWELFESRIRFNFEKEKNMELKKDWRIRMQQCAGIIESERRNFLDIFALDPGASQKAHPIVIITAAKLFVGQDNVEKMLNYWKNEKEGGAMRKEILAYCCEKLVNSLGGGHTKFLKDLLVNPKCQNEFTLNDVLIYSSASISNGEADIILEEFTQNGWLRTGAKEGGTRTFIWVKVLRDSIKLNLGVDAKIEKHEYGHSQDNNLDYENQDEINKQFKKWKRWCDRGSEGITFKRNKDGSITTKSTAVEILYELCSRSSETKIESKGFKNKFGPKLLENLYIATKETLNIFLEREKETLDHSWMKHYYYELLQMHFDCIDQILEKRDDHDFSGTYADLIGMFWSSLHKFKELEVDRDSIKKRIKFFEFYTKIVVHYRGISSLGNDGKRNLSNVLIEMGALLQCIPQKFMKKENMIIDEDLIPYHYEFIDLYTKMQQDHFLIPEPKILEKLRSCVYWISLKLSVTIQHKRVGRREFNEYWRWPEYSEEGKKTVVGFMNSDAVKNMEKYGLPLISDSGEYNGEWIFKNEENFINYFIKLDEKRRPKIRGKLIYVKLEYNDGWVETKEIDGKRIRIQDPGNLKYGSKHYCKVIEAFGDIILAEIIDLESLEPINKIIPRVDEILKKNFKKWFEPGIVYLISNLHEKLNEKFQDVQDISVLKWITGEYFDDYGESFCEYGKTKGYKLEVRGGFFGYNINERQWGVELPTYIENNPEECHIIFRGQGANDNEKGPLSFPIFPSIFADRIQNAKFYEKRQSKWEVTPYNLGLEIYLNIQEEESVIRQKELQKYQIEDGNYCMIDDAQRGKEFATILTNFPELVKGIGDPIDWSKIKVENEKFIHQYYLATIKFCKWRGRTHPTADLNNITSKWEKIIKEYFEEVKTFL